MLGLNGKNIYDEHTNVVAAERPLPVIEIFGPTIQGEGVMIGVKTMFVRMGGCDYRCAKCDSLHAVIPAAVKANRTLMTQAQIGEKLFEAKKNGCNWVTLSGGNPAIWDLDYLIDICNAMGMKVAIETQATVWRDWVGRCDQITLSPKSPGMGEEFNHEVFRAFMSHLTDWRSSKQTKLPSGETVYDDFQGAVGKTCLKIVCFGQMDMDFALGVGELYVWLGGSTDALYLSLGNPYPPKLNMETLKLEQDSTNPDGTTLNLPDQMLQLYRMGLEDYLQDDRFGDWKFLPQLHVLIWGNKSEV